MLKTIRWLLITLALTGGALSAQTPTAAVNDYLSEVRIFANGSPDFVKIASGQGVDATLPTLPGASLVVAIRNDSGEAIDSMRILYSVEKNGRPISRVTLYGTPLAPGATTLFAPREVGLSELTPRQGLGIRGGGPAGPIDFYLGAPVTASIDSATLASGKFIGADTQNFFDRLVAELAMKKAFFSDLTGFQSAGLSQSEIEDALTKRQAAADVAKKKMAKITDLNLAARTESSLCQMALMQLQHSGVASVWSWVDRETAALKFKPSPHR
jgi:hypothetical protein